MKKIKYGKILAIFSLTILIWVWADLAQDDEYPVPGGAVISVAKTNQNLWVSFNDEPSIAITKLVLKGPVSKINEAKRKINDRSLTFDFFLDPEPQGMTTAGQYTLPVPDFLKNSNKVKQLGLTVLSCKPQTLTVNVVELIKKPLNVKCIDENRNPIKDAAIQPAQVEMFVPGHWDGQALTAYVMLTAREISQARLAPIEKIPSIELAPGQTRQASAIVKITAPPEKNRLADYTITTPTLGFSLSVNLQGKYKVELTNPDSAMRPIAIRATPDAKRTYEKLRYQVILEIDDEDAKSTEPLRKELIYNFPAEYVRRDEITLNQPPEIAQFKLVPLLPASESPAE